ADTGRAAFDAAWRNCRSPGLKPASLVVHLGDASAARSEHSLQAGDPCRGPLLTGLTMPLQSKHFTEPKRNARLEQCLVSDPSHVMPGSRGDHVALIQTALNKLAGHSDGEDFQLATSGEYDSETAYAVRAFKERRDIVARPRQTKADNVVGKMTIKALDEEMLALEAKPKPGTVSLHVTPTFGGGLVGGCDMNGFSRARLARPGNSGDWTLTDPAVPVHQMIPHGLKRSLRFICRGLATLAFTSADPLIAAIVSVTQEAGEEGPRYVVTLKGRRSGITDLSYTLNGIAWGRVRINVRERKTVELDAVYLGPRSPPPGSGDDMTGFAEQVFSWLNLIVTPQTNIVFSPISVRSEPVLRFRGGPPFEADPTKPLYICKNSETPPKGAQAITWTDLKGLRRTKGVTLFYARRMRE
ncbi:MAG: hypothetical protein U0987_20455, partial [Afipia sp.]|nr:hypothetical protein [Afipia sp.]